MSVFEDMYRSDGTSYHRAESKTYELKDIADYLSDCMRTPQNHTKVNFEIRDDGEVYITTFRDDFTGATELQNKSAFCGMSQRKTGRR